MGGVLYWFSVKKLFFISNFNIMKKLFISTLLVLAIIGLFSLSSVDAQTTPNTERGSSFWSTVLKLFGINRSERGSNPITQPAPASVPNRDQASPSPVSSPVSQPQIDSIIGPSSILVNQVGTWSIQAKNATKYAVIWNVPVTASDSSKNSTPLDNEFGASNFITHAFTKPGNYHVKFFAKSSSGMVDVEGLDVKVNTLQSATAPVSNSTKSATTNTQVGSASSPSIKVISPNGGEILKEGSTYQIKWNSSSGIGKISQINLIDINENRTSSLGAYVIATNINNTGSYNWTVPQDLHLKKDFSYTPRFNLPNFKIRIYAYCTSCSNTEAQEIVMDESDSSFTVGNSLTSPSPSPSPVNQPSVSLIYPKGGETWYVGETKTVTWNYSNFDSNVSGNKYVKLLLIPTDGRVPVELASNYVAPYDTIPLKIYLKTSDGRDAWLPGRYKMKVVCDSNNVVGFKTCSDETSGYITVVDPNPTPSPTSTVQPTTSLNNNKDIQASIWSAVKEYYKSQETR